MASSAEADSPRYFDVMVGGRGAQMGGAFTALADDGSAAYYNPAGLSQIETGTVSLSANAFDYQITRIRNFLFGRDVVLRSNAFYPSAWSAVKRTGNVRMAVSAVVIADSDASTTNRFQNIVSDGTPIDNVLVDVTAKEQVYLVGPSLSFPLRPDLFVGATAYYWYGESEQNQAVFVGIDNPSQVAERIEKVSSVTQGGWAQLGVLSKPRDSISLGLVVRSPVFLTAKTDSQERSYSFDQTQPFLPFERTFEEGVHRETIRRPIGLLGGLAWRKPGGPTLSADLSYFGSAHYDRSGVDIEFRPVLNGAVGAEMAAGHGVVVRAGAYTNRSAAPPLNSRPTVQLQHLDYYGGTLGVGFLGEISTLELGLRYAYGTGEAKNPGTGRRFGIQSWVYTLFVSGSVLF